MTPEARLFLTILRRSPGSYFCVSTKKARTGKWDDHFFPRAKLSEAMEFAQAQVQSNVYMCPHGFSKPKRQKEFAEDPCLLYADLDERDPRELSVKPTIAIESSPGRYVGYWFTDEPASEELNRRLCYFIGADTSGWDRTQVLRTPGTKNFKYKDQPTVKTLWSDGPRYEVARLEKLVPQEEGTKAIPGGDVAQIYKKYEKQLPQWARREFINPKVQPGKRSEVLWKLLNECLEVGMSEDEAFTICWHSPWNKYIDRRNGEDQMRREFQKILDNHVGGSLKKAENKEDPTKRKFEIVTMDQVEEETVHWLVPYMIAIGQTTIFEGDPGVGKSYFLMWLCIHLCDGIPLPWMDKRTKISPMKVLYCDMENSAGSVTKVRLSDNGLKNGHNYMQLDQPFSIDDPDSLDAFEDLVVRFKPSIVIIDPVNVYIGATDTYRASETQQALHVLKQLAEDHQFSLVIVRHLNKGASGKALYAGNGSIAFAGVARIIATIGWHPEQADMRVVACTKNNVSKFFGSLGYTIEPLPDTLAKKDRSRLVYEGHVDFSSDDILGTSNQKEEGSLAIAKDLIRELIKEDKEVNYHSLITAADTRSISEISLRKAAAELGMKKVTKGRGTSRKTFLVKND